jgi:hypothetical protein
MTSSPPALRTRYRLLLWAVLLGAVLGYAAWDSTVVGRHLLRLTANYGVTVDAPAIDPRSPTGYADGLRSLVLPAAAADTGHWLMQTQQMFAQGEWRVRHVDYDNAPQGREVHWASPVHWWLAFLAWCDHLASGRPIALSVERATLLAGPVMFPLVVLGLVALLARRFSETAAAIAAIGAVASYPFYIDFVPGDAGHHAPANLCCLLTVLFFLAGCLGPVPGSPSPAGPVATGAGDTDWRQARAARRWFAASGAAAATGLWISAATETPVLVGLGLGVLAATWIARAVPDRLAWVRDPGLLRTWGWVGGGVSLAAYLVEYFPSHLGMRLEVNHPLYALALAGAGEALPVAARALCTGIRSLTRREINRGAIGAAMVAALPATLALTSPATFVVADPFVWHLHADYITEFQGLVGLLLSTGFSWNMVPLFPPMLVLVPPLVLLFRRTLAPEEKALIAFAEVPALLTLLLGWSQARWLGLAFAMSVPAIAMFFRTLESGDAGRRNPFMVWALACGLLFVPGAIGAVHRTLAAGELTKEEVHLLVERDVAHWLRARAGTERVVVASAPDSTSKLVLQGGLVGLGTLYWENAAGLKNAAALFAAPSAEAAHELVRRLGVTHLVFFSWDPFEFAMVKLARGAGRDSALPTDSFIARLLSAAVPPPWLRAVPFQLPANATLEGDKIRIWEVTDDQSPPEMAAQAANYYLETGRPDLASQLAPALAGFPDDLAAAVMLAGVEAGRQDRAAFSAALDRVMAQLPRAQFLPLDERVHTVVVLALGQRLDLARDQLLACVRQANERALRHLTPGTLSDLLSLCDALHVELPDPALKQLAERLVPPFRRK